MFLDDVRALIPRLAAVRYFALDDLRQQYRRTLLGPLWLVFSTCAYVFAFAFVMAGLFNQSIQDFLPHIIIGMFLWSFLALCLTDGCNVFIQAAGLIHSMRLSLLFHPARAGMRYLLMLTHYMLVAAVLMLLVGHHFTLLALLALPGLLIVAVAGLCAMLCFALVNTRYRDLMPMTTLVCQLMPMVTPIAWKVEMLHKYQWIALLNPIYHLIEVVRAPLLGQLPSTLSYVVAGGMALGFFLLGVLLYSRARYRLIFWI